jgi:ribonuclease I
VKLLGIQNIRADSIAKYYKFKDQIKKDHNFTIHGLLPLKQKKNDAQMLTFQN